MGGKTEEAAGAGLGLGGKAEEAAGTADSGKTAGTERMHQTWLHIQDGFCQVLKQDRKVRRDAFSNRFTAEQFAGILFSLMLAALVRKDYNPEPVLEVVRRTLY